MREADLSLVALAQRTGTGPGTIYAWFRGLHVPRNASIETLADALGVTSSYLREPWLSAGVISEGTGPGASDGPGLVALTEAVHRLAAALEVLVRQPVLQADPSRVAADLDRATARAETARRSRSHPADGSAEGPASHPAP